MKTKEITISDLFDKVWRDHWDTPRFRASGWATEVRRLYERQIGPVFGQSLLKALTAKKVRAWHGAMAATPVSANRALEVLSKLCSYAVEREWLPAEEHPTRFLKAFKEKKRRRFATPEEIGRIAAILEREKAKNPRAVAFIYTLMFSGARPRSIERSTWNELTTVEYENQTFGVLTFYGKSTAETGEDEQVILPPQALVLIMSLHEKGTNKDPNSPLFGIKMPKDFWRRVRKEAGCEDLWARDWRRTFGVVGMSNDVTIGTIGELLNHKSTQTTKRYAGLFQTKRLEATKLIADKLSTLLKGGNKC